jgi:hypothetical protein
VARATFVAGLAALGLAALAGSAANGGPAILFAAIGINLLIVSPWFVARRHAARLRRFLPPWLPW